jgi:hypothetical protein
LPIGLSTLKQASLVNGFGFDPLLFALVFEQLVMTPLV